MPVSTKTKAVAALGVLDIARQVATAWSAKHQAEQQRLDFGRGIAVDLRHAARDVRDRIPWGRPPTARERIAAWAPVALVTMLATAAIVVAARVVARREDTRDPEQVVTDSRVVGAVRAGSQAIDAGVAKVVDGGSAVAAGAASTVAAGSSAVRTAGIGRARAELDERVVQPAKRKAIVYGSLGVVGLTVYVILIATAVALLVDALG